MAKGVGWQMGMRSETCRMYGHYFSSTMYDFSLGEFVTLPTGVKHCGWCHETTYPWIDPEYWFCVGLTIARSYKRYFS